MTSTNQTLCTLGAYSFPYNAPTQQLYEPVSSNYTPTLGGGYITVFGALTQDKTIQLTWPVMSAPVYWGIYAEYIQAVQLTFIDWLGVTHTVFCEDFKPTSQIRASNEAFTDVVLRLRLISTP